MKTTSLTGSSSPLSFTNLTPVQQQYSEKFQRKRKAEKEIEFLNTTSAPSTSRGDLQIQVKSKIGFFFLL
jgi:hypothetical protein